MKNILTLPILLSGLTASASTTASLTSGFDVDSSTVNSTFNNIVGKATKDSRFKNTLFYTVDLANLLLPYYGIPAQLLAQLFAAQISNLKVRVPLSNVANGKLNLGILAGASQDPQYETRRFYKNNIWGVLGHNSSHVSVLVDMLWLVSDRISMAFGVGGIIGLSLTKSRITHPTNYVYEVMPRFAGRFMFAVTPSINVGVSATFNVINNDLSGDIAFQLALSQDIIG